MFNIGDRVEDTSGRTGFILTICLCGCGQVSVRDEYDMGIVFYTYMANLTFIGYRPKKIEPLPLPG